MNLTQIKNGVFTLDNKFFSPIAVFEQLMSVFEPIISNENLEIDFQVVPHLTLDNEEAKQVESDSFNQSEDQLLLNDSRLIIPERQRDIRSETISGSLPAYIYGDERRLKQVLINLIKNAKKFTRQGSI